MCVVEKLFESFVRTEAKVVAAMHADLLRFFQLFFVKMLAALFATHKDILSTDDAILIAHRLDLAFLLTKPGHKTESRIRSQFRCSLLRVRRLAQKTSPIEICQN